MDITGICSHSIREGKLRRYISQYLAFVILYLHYIISSLSFKKSQIPKLFCLWRLGFCTQLQSLLKLSFQDLLSKFAILTGATMVKNWRQNVTHVITSTDGRVACRRSHKVLMAILHGKWVVRMTCKRYFNLQSQLFIST